MESPSPSLLRTNSSRSESPHGSHLTTSSQKSFKTGLVSSHNGQRSYGTVKHLSTSNSFKRSAISVIHHHVEEGDTIQGLALKYSVTVSWLGSVVAHHIIPIV